MGDEVTRDKVVVTAEEDFSHYITLVTVVLDVVLCAQIVEAKDVRDEPAVSAVTIPVDDLITVSDELVGYFPTRLHCIT